MQAVKAAMQRNFAIEVDLQLAEDGVPMVFHDSKLDRLTAQSGPLSARSSAELETIFLSGSTDRIPSFDALLEEVDGKVPLIVELKPHGARTQSLAAGVMARLARYSGPLALQSFDPVMLCELARIGPGLPRGIIADATPASPDWRDKTAWQRFVLRHLLHIPRSKPHFIAYDCKALPAIAPIGWKRFCGLPLLSWTVRTRSEQLRLRPWVDQVIFEGFDPDDTELV